MSTDRIERLLATAPGEAQPSKIVATEIAFARAARDDGQWTAFRDFAAPGAVIHGVNGPIEAERWLAAQDDPEQAVQWAPRSVWISCDSFLAVSLGRFREPGGQVGSFVTVWQRQRDGTYRWFYDAGAVDDPQPAKVTTPAADDAIVVTALDAVDGHVTDCSSRNSPVRPAPTLPSQAERHGVQTSPDGTLQWYWEHRADGSRRVVVNAFTEGEWREAFDQRFAAPEADQSR